MSVQVTGGTSPTAPARDRDQFRLALSLSGGVSLAVWIGGVTHEVNEARTGSGAWRDVLDLVATDVVVDVISGASAGGISGAVLAQAITHGASTEPMRRLWVTSAGIEKLLREPTQQDARSLFRGDDYLLDLLRTTFTQLGDQRGGDEHGLDLTLTGTLLRGVPNQYPDDFGTVVSDVSNRARFRFRRDPRSGIDHFAEPGIADRLARAARSTSAFPGAFEASFVRVDDGDEGGATGAGSRAAPRGSTGSRGAAARPYVNMRDHVDFPSSRWVIDGGVLANQPLEDTLRAVYGQKANGQVRRSVLLVSPDPGAPETDVPDRADAEPGVVDVLRGAFAAPWVQSLASDLHGYRRHNEQVRRLHESRDAVVVGMGPVQAVSAADSAFQVYQATRRRSSARFVREQFVEQITRHLHEAAFLDWEQDAIYRLVVAADPLPWLPSDPPGALRSLADVRAWGLFPLERAIGVLIDVLVRTLDAANDPDARAGLSELLGRCYDDGLDPVTAARKRSSRLIRTLLHEHGLPPATGPAQRPAALRDWACAVVADWLGRDRDDEDLAQRNERIARAVAEIAVDLGRILDEVVVNPGSWVPDAERDTLEHWAAWLRAANGDRVAALRTLLVFEVLENSFGNNRIETPQVLRFVQVSGDTFCPSIGVPLPIEKKITGAQLAHVGAFLKPSWRANDWMWGRLDSAASLSKILLDPARLHQLYPPSPDAPGRLHDDLHRDSDPLLGRLTDLLVGKGPDAAYLERRLPRDRIVAETDFLRDAGQPTPPSLPELAAAFARRRNLEILREELPHLHDATEGDGAAAGRSPAEQEFRQHYREVTRDGTLAAAGAEALLRGCGIGAETASGELGTPRMTTTAVKTFAAATNTLHGAAGSATILKGSTGALRGVALAAYRLQTATRDPSPLTRWVVAGVLSSSLTIAILGAFAQGIPGWLQGAAWAVLVAGAILLLAERPSPPAAAAALVTSGAAGVLTWFVLREPIDLTQVSVLIAGIVAAIAAAGTFALLRRLRRRKASAGGDRSARRA